MAFDLIAMLMLGIVYVLVRWASSLYRRIATVGQNESSSSTFRLFRKYGVDWGWKEPVQVGETMSFTIKFFGLAGMPRDVSEVENLKVEIMKNSLTIAHVEESPADEELVRTRDSSEHGVCEQRTNEIKVSFTVRASGVYTISISENGRHITGSPFEKAFIPGPPVASRTTLLRALNSAMVVPIVQSKSHLLTIEPRDEFGNACGNRLHAHALRDEFTLMVTEIGDDDCVPIPVSTDLRLSRGNITVDLFVPISGCFHAVAAYGDEVIGNGEFDLIVLTASEMAEVSENLERRNLNVYYEAKLLNALQDSFDKGDRILSRTMSSSDVASSSRKSQSSFKLRRLSSAMSGTSSKAKAVYCYITPKQLVVKEFFLRFFPKRLHAFRLCQATQITVNSPGDSHHATVITISDNCQPSYVLSCPKSHVLIATFIGILNRNIGGSDSFEEKVKHFRQELLTFHKIGKYSRGKAFITVDRENLLLDSYKQTKSLTAKEWCRQFQVTFEGEMGVDWGGLSREWISQLCKTLFVPRVTSETEGDGDAKSKDGETCLFRSLKDDNQSLVLPSPCHISGVKLKLFEFAGKIVGKCLLDSAFERDQIKYVTARFARSFLAQIIGLAVTFKHFESDDPELFKSKIRYIIENDVSDFDLCFAEEEYNSSGKLVQVVPLKPNGAKIRVTNDNKLEYLNRLAQYRLSVSVKQEVEAFNKGLNYLVPEHLLSMFDENELELVMCGSSKISITDMRRYCLLNDTSQLFMRTMNWFWAVISSFTQDELAMLLQFVTGCSQLPPGGFSEMSPRFKISYIFYQSNNLPTAHTCFNELCLPMYDSYDQLHKMLKLAITEGAVGFGMI